MPDEKHPIAEKEEPPTKEEIADQFQQLSERAKAAGLSPLQMMIQAYAEQGRAVVEGLLGAYENAGSTKKKEK